MAYTAYITKIKNLRPHNNADRLQCGTIFGSNVIVGLNTQEDELGVYFPTDGKLGFEYAQENNLLRMKDAEGNHTGGYLDPEKRNIKALKLRGEQSDGLFMPLTSLESFADISALNEGDQITVLGGKTICEKYIPRGNRRCTHGGTGKSKRRQEEKVTYPVFFEHSDTSQLAYNLSQFKEGDRCLILLKLHGTSQRTAHTIKETRRNLFGWLRRLLNWLHFKLNPVQVYDYITGTRRVILKNMVGGWYGSNAFRQQHHDKFIGKLPKLLTVYYEVVGYVSETTPIMSDCSNKKLNDKAFVAQYGDTTRFSYGCDPGESNLYVYRMTMTNEDGFVLEIPWDTVKNLCEKMGVDYAPELERFVFTTEEDMMERVNKHADGPDPIGGTHLREGVVVRIENRETFAAFKHKSFAFKVLEGIIKESADAADMEEAQESKEEVA